MSLWEHFRKCAKADTFANTEKLVGYATPLLDLIRDTFPTYTLHNHTHAENVISLMESLLGERLDQLSSVECSLLILSAYYHDIGMVFSDDEKAQIVDDERFDTYLREHPDHYLEMRAGGDTVDDSIIEGFCRWCHAERVYDILQHGDLDPEWFMWGRISIRNYLGLVCQSHGSSADDLKSEEFLTDFLGGQCDLRFCAVILRVADLLDFDNSRSPDAVYKYLGIGRRDDPRSHQSDVEWRKHLSSDGFVFPAHRDETYTLSLICGPDSPAVEHDLRGFIDTIDRELVACQTVVKYCSARWSDFVLPSKIDRRHILSQGYKYGDFKFSFDRDAILELFMGERLYSNPLVFVRELIQNSIDATRARALLSNSDSVTKGWAIDLSSWFDHLGRQWIRIDDNGIGMNQNIIENYLLRVGRSYYSSSEFQADLMRGSQLGQPSIVSIGRFGVGLLTVFMVADLVELTTRRIGVTGTVEPPIRMQFDHLAGFATLQQPKDVAQPFPSAAGPEPGYRAQPGTSIALRIDPTKFRGTVDLEPLVRTQVMGSRVAIRVNNRIIEDGARQAAAHMVDEVVALPIDWDIHHKLEAASRLAHGTLTDEIIDAISNLVLTVTPYRFDERQGVDDLCVDLFVIEVNAAELRRLFADCDLRGYPGLRLLNELPDSFHDRIQASLGEVQFYVAYGSETQLPDVKIFLFGEYELRRDEYLSMADNEQDRMTVLRLLDDIDRVYGAFLGNRGAPLREFVGQVAWNNLPSETLSKLAQSDWSHNGVKLPTPADWTGASRTWLQCHDWQTLGEEDDGELRNRYVDGARSGLAQVRGLLWLENSLRPDLNVARDGLTRVPLNVNLSINLALHRCAAPYGGIMTAPAHSSITSKAEWRASYQHATLADFAADATFCRSNGWTKEALYRFSDGSYRSVEEVRERIRSDDASAIEFGFYVGDFAQSVRMAVLLLNIEVAVDGTGELMILGAAPGDLSDLLPFVPGSVVPYEDTSVLLYATKDASWVSTLPINSRHPLFQWFLRVRDLAAECLPTVDEDFLEAAAGLSSLFEDADDDADQSDNAVLELREYIEQISSVLPRAAMHGYEGVIDDSLIRLLPSTQSAE